MYKPPPDADRPDADPRADLDRDGIKDVDDACIAPEVDGLLDSDQDMVPNATDSCPFDKLATTDADGDGIADACDPFSTAGDRLRCLMVFSDPDMNVVMWRGRDAQSTWILYEPRILFGNGGSIIADWPLEGSTATTAFDVYGSLGFTTGGGTFDVLVRAAPTPQPTDAGCRLTTGSQWSLGILPGPSAVAAVQQPTSGGYFRFRVTLQPASTGTNVRCVLSISTAGTTLISGTTMWPAGHVAFATTTRVAIYGIAVYERDDAPPL